MKFPKLMGIASGIALSSTMALAWSISGVVTTTQGQPLGGVEINSFNYAGVSAASADDGTFTISNDGQSAIASKKASNLAIHMEGNMLIIYNVDGDLKVSVINALGKVLKESSIDHLQGIVSLDLGNLAKGAKFIRINSDHSNSTFMVTDKGVKSLKKEGDPLPAVTFSKAGYKNFPYQAKAEVETNVVIKMEADTNPTSSSTVQPPQSSSVVASSSSVAPSSSSVAAPVIDCSGKTVKAGDQNMSVTVDGKKRTFIMHVPSAYKGDKPVPLVVDYHPIGGSGSQQSGGTTYKAQTDPEGVISLYPDGTAKGGGGMMGNMPGWNVGPCCSNDDDVKFSREMINAVKEIACIDPQRIYATGFSMGGGMSNHVACFMSDVYAAVAPAGMDLNKTNSAQCNPERPISVINFRGTNDGTCRYEGGDSGFNDGLNFLGAQGTFKFWAEKNGCQGSPSKNKDNCDEYSNCRDGVKVVLCTKQGGGHEQGDGKVGWPFLKSFTLPASFVK